MCQLKKKFLKVRCYNPCIWQGCFTVKWQVKTLGTWLTFVPLSPPYSSNTTKSLFGKLLPGTPSRRRGCSDVCVSVRKPVWLQPGRWSFGSDPRVRAALFFPKCPEWTPAFMPSCWIPFPELQALLPNAPPCQPFPASGDSQMTTLPSTSALTLDPIPNFHPEFLYGFPAAGGQHLGEGLMSPTLLCLFPPLMRPGKTSTHTCKSLKTHRGGVCVVWGDKR